MPYSTGPEMVRRYKGELDQIAKLESGQVLTLRCDPEDINKLSFHLRSAMFAAAALKMPVLDQLHKNVKIKRVPTGLEISLKRIHIRTPSREYTEQDITYNDCYDEFDVVNAMLKHNILFVAVFPKFEGDINSVHSWAAHNKYVVLSESPLKLDASDEIKNWKPTSQQ